MVVKHLVSFLPWAFANALHLAQSFCAEEKGNFLIEITSRLTKNQSFCLWVSPFFYIDWLHSCVGVFQKWILLQVTEHLTAGPDTNRAFSLSNKKPWVGSRGWSRPLLCFNSFCLWTKVWLLPFFRPHVCFPGREKGVLIKGQRQILDVCVFIRKAKLFWKPQLVDIWPKAEPCHMITISCKVMGEQGI